MDTTSARKIEKPCGPKIQMAALVAAACRLFEVKPAAVHGYDQSPKLSQVRGLIVYTARKRLGETFAIIGAHMNRDSSTAQNTFRGLSERGLSSEMLRDVDDIIEVALELQTGTSDEIQEWEEVELPRGGRLSSKYKELRPAHAIGEAGSEEWFQSCEAAFRSGMIKALWEAKAERDARFAA